jgi:hypothetical protein
MMDDVRDSRTVHHHDGMRGSDWRDWSSVADGSSGMRSVDIHGGDPVLIWFDHSTHLLPRFPRVNI